MAFRSMALQLCVIALTLVVSQSGHASTFSCRQAYRSVRENVSENMSSLALAFLEAYRRLSVNPPISNFQDYLEMRLSKILYLESRLTPDEQAVLANRLVDPGKLGQSTSRLIAREVFKKDFARELLEANAASESARRLQIQLQKQTEAQEARGVLLEAQTYLDRFQSHLKPYQRELVLNYLEDAVFVDPYFHKDPTWFLTLITPNRGDGPMPRGHRIIAAFLSYLKDHDRLEAYLEAVKRGGFKPLGSYSAFDMAKLWNGGRAAIEASVARFVTIEWPRATGRNINHQLDAVQTYLLGIFRDRAFQDNPIRFMNAEEYTDVVTASNSIAESVAWAFLQKLAAGSQLESFVQEIRDTKYYQQTRVRP